MTTLGTMPKGSDRHPNPPSHPVPSDRKPTQCSMADKPENARPNGLRSFESIQYVPYMCVCQ